MIGESNITLMTAFVAGIISFLSPCVLPMLPTYTAFLAGTATGDGAKTRRWYFLMNAFFFLSGLILVFVAMGATASYFGQFFFEYQNVIRKVGAVFMVLMGIHLLGIIRLSVLTREYRPILNNTFRGPFGAFVLGIAFTAGWTPCTGPILASILVYAGASATLSQGAYLLFIYAMGFCIPFLLIAVLLNRYLAKAKGLYSWMPFIQQMAGGALIIAGVFIYFDLMQKSLGMFWNIFGY